MTNDTEQQFTAALTSELRQLFTDDSEHSATEHPFDNIELLAKIEDGTATPAERNGLLRHLSCCSNCRERFTLLCEHGTLFDSDFTQDFTSAARARAGSTGMKRRSWTALLTSAASLLICLGSFGTLETPVQEYEGAKSFSFEPVVEKPVNNMPKYVIGTLAGSISIISLLYACYTARRKND